jgi:TonB family protein
VKKVLAILISLLFSVVVWGQVSEHVKFFSSEALKGRAAGSQGEKQAAQYLYNAFQQAGLHMLTPPSGEDFSIVEGGDTLHSQNIIGMVEGYDELLRNQYIIVGANIDHIGTNILTIDGKAVEQIYPGANDNASGLAALIEVAKRVSETSFFFKRSVIFVGFGAKERGMAGSWYFANRSFNYLDSVSLMIDINSIGVPSQERPFSYYTGNVNPEINHLMGQMSQLGGYYTPVFGTGTLLPSDYLAFYERNIPVMLLTTGMDNVSRTPRDTPQRLDYQSMDYMCDFIYTYIREVANRDLMIVRVENVQQGEDAPVADIGRVYSPYEIDTPPTFLKGNEIKFLEDWVYKYLRYPESALNSGIQGVVIVEFIVETDGSVTNVEVVRGNDDALEDEALRVVSASPKWKPGKLSSQKVRVKYSLPVEFKLRKRK